MMTKLRTLTLALAVLLATPAFAQNLAGTIGIDLVPGNPHFAGGSGTDTVDPDSDIDLALTVAPGQTFPTLVRVNGAEDLLGITFDFTFDNSKLQVVDIRETRMDLDFDGQQSFAEVDAIVQFFLAGLSSGDASVAGFNFAYNDGTADIVTQPGILLDLDNDGNFGFSEIDAYINEFLANLDLSDVPFWTEVVARRGGFNESVEIFDTPAQINAAGEATDNTAVLLRRPETPAAGFGFDGNAIIMEIVFRALPGAAAGPTDITITNASGIDENFSNIADIKGIATATPSVVTIGN